MTDAFTGPELDRELWTPLVTPTPDGGEWVYQEPDAVTTTSRGVACVEIPRFTRSHDTLQSQDNAKHLLISTRSLSVPDSGTVTFSVEMAARKINGDDTDYRDGFATFSVFDLQTLLILDMASTGNRFHVIYEHIGASGIAEGDDAFAYVIDAPFAGVATTPGQFHRYQVTLDADTASAAFTVDKRLIYTIPKMPIMPSRVNLGMGLMTLCPLADGHSTSLRGQGMIGSWRKFTYTLGLHRGAGAANHLL